MKPLRERIEQPMSGEPTPLPKKPLLDTRIIAMLFVGVFLLLASLFMPAVYCYIGAFVGGIITGASFSKILE